MKVSNDQHSADYQKKLDKTQRNLVSKKEQEIEKLKNIYDQKVQDAKVEGDINVFNQSELNKIEIEQQITNKENRLEKIKGDLKDHTEKFDSQKNTLTTNYTEQLKNLNNVHEDNIRELYSSNLTQGVEIHEDLNLGQKQLQVKARNEMDSANFNAKIQSNARERGHQQKLASVEKNHQTQIKYAQGENDEIIKEIESNHQSNVEQLQRKNTNDIGEKVQTQELQAKTQEEHYNESLKQKRISFEEKYNTLEKQHTEILNRIKTKFDFEIKNLVSQYSDTKTLHEQKAQDDFYHVTKVDPIVTDMKDHYLISVNVPEHEKEFVNLTAQERNLNFSLTRKFDDQTNGLGNSEYKTKRSEVLTKKFTVPDIMDSKDITQKFENGLLQFKIKKL